MTLDRWSKRMMAATVVMSLLFTGNTLTGQGQAASPPTESTRPSTAVPETAPPPTVPTEPEENPLFAEIAAKSDGKQVFLWDGQGQRMLFCSGGETESMYPASITKLYAAYVALMHLSPEETVTAGEELRLVQPGSSRAFISRGCVLTVEMLVEAMLIPSGNDGAYVLSAAAGRAIAGDENLDGAAAVEMFVEEMNRVAQELGFQNSHFMNPDGYHHENHYMCPADAALVGMLALENPVIAKYAAKSSDAVTFQSGEHIAWYNTNHLINPESPYYSPSALGLKTGYTDAAGQCLLSAFRDGERVYIIGIFGAEKQYLRYDTAKALFEAAVDASS